MFEDLTRDIKAALYDRARSPLFFAFVAAWVVWNSRGIVVFLSDADLELKFRLWHETYGAVAAITIGNESFQILYAAITRLFVGPLLTSIAFILIYPWPARWTFHYWQWHHTKVKKIQQELEDQTPMTRDEEKTLRLAMLEQQATMQQRLQASSDSYKEALSQRDVAMEQIAKLMNELSEQQKAAQTAADRYAHLEAETKNMKGAFEINSAALAATKRELDNLRSETSRPEKEVSAASSEEDKLSHLRTSHQMGEVEAKVFLALVLADGAALPIHRLVEVVKESRIEIEVVLRKLASRKLIAYNNENAVIDDAGKTLAVNERLTRKRPR